jgi:hypothetical protein
MAKTLRSFRLSDTAHKNLERLARRWRISQADVIALLAKVAAEGDFEDFTSLDDVADQLRDARNI